MLFPLVMAEMAVVEAAHLVEELAAQDHKAATVAPVQVLDTPAAEVAAVWLRQPAQLLSVLTVAQAETVLPTQSPAVRSLEAAVAAADRTPQQLADREALVAEELVELRLLELFTRWQQQERPT